MDALSDSLTPPGPGLSRADLAAYARDGFVIVRGLLSPDEAGVLRAAISADGALARNAMGMRDGAGRVARLALWQRVRPATCYGALAASRRVVGAVRELFAAASGLEAAAVSPYHIHTKCMLKEPRTGGAFNVHQDFGYWSQCGCLEPDLMMSVVFAVDEHDRENGCLHVLRGSHRLGRLDHGSSGEQAGADPRAVAAARLRFEDVACEMRPGDALFTHSNLVHWSGPNESERWRLAVIVAFNDARNGPDERGAGIIPPPHELAVVDDGELLRIGPKGHDDDNDESGEAGAGGAAAEWLGQEKNVGTFGRSKKDFSAEAEAFAAEAERDARKDAAAGGIIAGGGGGSSNA
jgi:ectoine hydroxylase-related dioxygenase (phytanoyl-CoA dioxygenase family)